MTSVKQLKLAQKSASHQEQVILRLNGLIEDIQRCEKTINALKNELEALNLKHRDRKTTRDDIAYLSDLLECAKKKLNWEKHIASLQKRTPLVLAEMTALINDTKNLPPDQIRAELLQALQRLQAAMEQLLTIKAASFS